VRKGLKASKVHVELKVVRDLSARKDRKAFLAHKDLKVAQDRKDRKAHKVVQGLLVQQGQRRRHLPQ
jgi:hypothetical protein